MTSKSLHPNQSKIMSYIRLSKYLFIIYFFPIYWILIFLNQLNSSVPSPPSVTPNPVDCLDFFSYLLMYFWPERFWGKDLEMSPTPGTIFPALTSASLAESQNIFQIKNIFPPKITGSVWPRHKYKFNVQNFKTVSQQSHQQQPALSFPTISCL